MSYNIKMVNVPNTEAMHAHHQVPFLFITRFALRLAQSTVMETFGVFVSAVGVLVRVGLVPWKALQVIRVVF